VDSYSKLFAAEVYKAFLRCAARIIRSEGGTITAYDGDRVMAAFIGNEKNTTAVRTGLKINWAVKNIIQPAIKNQYTSASYVLRHVVGIDTSMLLVARAGIRGANDLVWVGRAANYAAKLCTLNHDYPTWITETVYNSMSDSSKVGNGQNMWESRLWTAMNNMRIYRSSWWWSL
jgi:class 3 adenylate cyclase